MLLSQKLELVQCGLKSSSLVFLWLGQVLQIQEVKQIILILVFYLAASHLYSHFSEQNKELPLFFLFLLLLFFFSVLTVPEPGQDGGCWSSTSLTKSFAHGRNSATSLEPAQAPKKTLLKPAFTKAKPDENAIAKTSKKIL